MNSVVLRQAGPGDIPALSLLRSRDWGTVDFWTKRLGDYIDGVYNPLDALSPRIIYTAVRENIHVGFAAGHISRRYNCDAELQWITVAPEFRGYGVASKLFHQIASWFADQNALSVCINCDNEDESALRFLTRHGAEPLSRHWRVWPDIRLHAFAAQ